MSTGAIAVPRRRTPRTQGLRAWVGALLRREGLLIVLASVPTIALASTLMPQISQDTWLALVSGREIATHGLPGHDTLTQWTAGRRWIDQQWLAQLTAFGLFRAGGLVLLALVHVACVGGTITLALVAGRCEGMRVRVVAWTFVATFIPILLGLAVRTQSFAYPLFALTLVLLVRDLRAPSRFVFAVVPVLVVWANVHGSVTVGALLVCVRAACDWRRPRRALVLAIGSVFALLATPWGLKIGSYYEQTLLNPVFKEYVSEWRPPTLGVLTAPLFLLLGMTVWLLARHWRQLHPFELTALLVLGILALMAYRNGVWLGIGAMVLLQRPLELELGGGDFSERRLNKLLALGALVATAVTVGSAFARGNAALSRRFPSAAAAAVRAATSEPRTRVYADERFADWLLIEIPSLRGRVAYDARFELLSGRQLQALYTWRNQIGVSWQRVPADADVIVLDRKNNRATEHALLRERQYRPQYSDSSVAVLVRDQRSR